MKKIICILVALMVMGTASFAQTKETKKPAKAPTTAAQPEQKMEPKAGKTKKDGTPDMRHKENKEAPKPEQKMKKDGTPDMRYKENKKK